MKKNIDVRRQKSMKQLLKLSKQVLIRKIIKALRVMPKWKIVPIAYEITKLELPRLGYSEYVRGQLPIKKAKRKTKRKFSRKQLAAQRLFAKRARAGTLKRRRR